MRWRELVFGMLGGAFAGAVIAAWLAAAPPESTRPARAADGVDRNRIRAHETPSPASARLVDPPPTPAASRESESAPVEDSLAALLARLHPHAESGIRRGWSTKRADEIPDDLLSEARGGFDALVREAPVRIGAELAERETRREKAREDARTGGAFTLLDELAKGGTGPLPDLVGDAQRFASLFQTTGSGPTRDGVASLARIGDAAEDGGTILFPVGVFQPRDLLSRSKPFPRDVTIAGAGMDATLLLLSDLSTRDDLRNLAFRDCTLHTSNDPLFDLRRRPATVQLTRVRLTGFDSGAGGSCAFRAPGMALHARNSFFVGGYGRSPSHARLFDVPNDALLARFERCTLEALRVGADRWRPGSTVTFVDCRLSELLDDESPAVHARPGVSFPGSQITLMAEEARSKDLNELFPNWQQRIDR